MSEFDNSGNSDPANGDPINRVPENGDEIVDAQTIPDPIDFKNTGGAVALQSSMAAGGPKAHRFTIAGKTGRLDRWIESASEWFSSILVKEVRQSLKSRFFVWPFFSLLVVVLIWALGAIGISAYENNLNQVGPVLLCGFFDILGFPLCIIIPYAAFRSLVHEFEDGTLQLVSITTLKPYQIISGKLVSALLQIVIYLSILAPCIVFTYLLRGVDIIQIMLALGAAVAGSICLCVIALFLASASRHRAVGIFASLVLLALLIWLFCLWCVLSYGITHELDASWLQNPEIQCVIYAFVAFIVTWALVMFTAACANISFPTENRSTLIRVALLIQHTVFLGWFLSMTTTISRIGDEFVYTTIIFMLFHWLIIGTMMCCVADGLSRKVRRGLPKTVFGKVFFSLLQPGPGRGYLFALGNLWTGVIFIGLVLATTDWLPDFFAVNIPGSQLEDTLIFLLINAIYFTFYLTVLYLFLNAMPRVRAKTGPMFGLLVVILFVPLVMLALPLLQLVINPGFNDYSMAHFLNGIYTAVEFVEDDPFARVSVIVVSAGTMCLCLLSFLYAGRELKEKVAVVPDRVQEEIDSGKATARALPPGESLDEIFGPIDGGKNNPETE